MNTASPSSIPPARFGADFWSGALAVLVLAASIGLAIVTGGMIEQIRGAIMARAAEAYSSSMTDLRRFYAQEIIPRALASGAKAAHDYRDHDGALPLPATLSIEIGRFLANEDNTFAYSLVSRAPFPWRKNRRLTDFEREALAFFDENPGAETHWRMETLSDNRSVMWYATPVRMDQSCVGCHNGRPDSPRTDWKPEDVRGVQVVSLSLPAARFASLPRDLQIIVAALFATMLAGVVLLAVYNWRSRRSAALTRALARAEAARSLQLDRAQRHLRESRDRLETVINAVAEAVMTLDENGRVLSANASAVLLFSDGDPGGLEGRSLFMLFADVMMEDGAEGVLRDLANDQGRISPFRARRLCGEVFMAEATVSVLPHEGRNRFVVVISDISSEYRSRKKVSDSEARLRATLQSALDPIIIIDHLGVIIEFNASSAECFRIDRERAIGQSMAEIVIPPESRAAHHAGLRRFLETGEARVSGRRIKIEAQRADGERFPCELAINHAPGPQGPLFIAFMRDITEQVKHEAALRQAKEDAEAATRVKSEFLAIMSHEIRTPLNGVLGVLSLLEDAGLSPDQKRLVRAGKTSGETLLAVINDILDFSKLEAGKMTLETSPSDIRQLVEDVLDLQRPLALRKSLGLRMAAEDAIPRFVDIDPGRVRQILLNLVSNAVKFTDAGAVEVIVSSSRTIRNGVRIAVRDTGAGIPEDRMTEVFGRFHTLDGHFNRKHSGAGLGLAICKALTEAMGGRIDVASPPGQGATFWLDIPAPASKTQDALCDISEESFRDMLADVRERRLRILLADDSPTNTMVAKRQLENFGARVDAAANGLEAVAAIEQREYDLVLMDVSMPEMDGLEATRLIRERADRKARVPIIAMTAHALDGDADRFLSHGMDDYLQKPGTRAAMLKTIAKWAGARMAAKDAAVCDSQPQTPPVETADPIVDEDTGPLVDEKTLDVMLGGLELEDRQALSETFRVEAQKLRDALAGASAREDVDAIGSICHRLASNAGSFGCRRLCETARAAERAAIKGDRLEAAAQARKAADLVSPSLSALRQTLFAAP